MNNIKVFFDAKLGNIPSSLFRDCAELVLRSEKRRASTLSYIIVSDETIHAMNAAFLGHDYPTDIITFPLSEDGPLEAEMYISADTARRNAAEYRVTLRTELARLAIHGALHLCGYDDGSMQDRESMKTKEDKYVETYLKKQKTHI